MFYFQNPSPAGQAFLRLCVWSALCAMQNPAWAEEPPAAPADSQAWAIHAQATNVTQGHRAFTSPYTGPNSLEARGRTEETTDLTLYAGLRLALGTEVWLNPEIDQGFGLSNTVGMAGFPSGEAYKVGANTPYLRLPRAFLRHVIGQGTATSPVEATANQLGGTAPADNLTLTIGKFSVTDIFDTNSYAHDPRSDFLNWSVIDAGAFDYAADAWGFTYGAAAEWSRGDVTLRAGLFQLSPVPNGKITAVDFHQHMLVGELEQRMEWNGHPGKIKFLAFVNRGKMGSYADAIALAQRSATAPDTALVRQFHARPGAAVNVEQELAAGLGAFLRLSANQGSQEAYEFTEINRAISGGLALRGERWGRADDSLGLAFAVNALSTPAQRYFTAGGSGILIGDGRLNYGAERIVETYYSFKLSSYAALSLNYQHAVNPAHNRDRGPVSLFALRTHVEF